MTRHKLKTTIPYGDTDLGAEVDVEITFDFKLGRPMVHTLRNGDPGYPADPPELEFVSVVQLVNGKEVVSLQPGWLDDLAQGWLESDRGETEALQVVADDDCAAREQAAENRSER